MVVVVTFLLNRLKQNILIRRTIDIGGVDSWAKMITNYRVSFICKFFKMDQVSLPPDPYPLFFFKERILWTQILERAKG